MRFTPDILLKHTQLLVEKETKKNRAIIAVYLQGSLLYGSPLLGGAGDIDLVFIHNSPPTQENQIIKLTPEIHFDIEHHDQILYRNTREIRLDPWLGPTIRDAKPLYDPRHFIDYTQAGARSNFDFPENIQARCKPLVDKSRQFWMDRQISKPGEILTELPAFLDALHNVVTAVALLSGPPLPTRRLGMDFQQRAAAVNAPGLAIAFTQLLGGISLTHDLLRSWLKEWDLLLNKINNSVSPPPLLLEKKIYYQAAMETILESNQPEAVLWPLLTTWTDALQLLPDDRQSQLAWLKAITTLGFAGNDYQTRLAALDGFIELCETLIVDDLPHQSP
jgi:hypothetical protein